MKLPFGVNKDKQLVPTGLSAYLTKQSSMCLFIPRWKAGLRPKFMEESLIAGRALGEKLRIKEVLWYAYAIDPQAGAIALCPPITTGEMDRVVFSRDAYDVAIRDACWPIEIIDVDDLSGFSLVNPTPNKHIEREPLK